ncbi:hypothetical protein FWK35_00004572 [Aphis craccivora]|uniref:Uncharacterized protein n=1 Tax=Aphis craccivora TaxID=307492 RepID=A0A6G0ZMM6_APHCR|nr:hypothetical protein FWK35_00004572 [Aphis craccivora]
MCVFFVFVSIFSITYRNNASFSNFGWFPTAKYQFPNSFQKKKIGKILYM